ncbi:MAG: TetR/AcrR family transcriptional regulator [Pseudomonadota bacterium]
MMATKGEENRARIVDAAIELFYKKGFANTSFAEIARHAGVPKGNFYFYFPSKDDILNAVIDARVAGLRGSLAQFEQEFDDPRDRLKRMADMPKNEFPVIMEFGCPMGTLTAELGKQQHELCDNARQMFTLLLEWAEGQFLLLGGNRKEAKSLAHQLLVRLQGASVMAQAYQDSSWILDEVEQTKRWIDTV